MENHQFEQNDQAQAYSLFRPDPPDELIQIIVSYLSREVHRPFGRAVDVGCGSGQSTIVLAPYFENVLGCDVSKVQIREAKLSRKKPNVEYTIASAESLPVLDQCVHLLTAATCFHWIDKELFFKEAQRVLAPGGVLAVYSSCAIYPFTGDTDTDIVLRQLTDQILYGDMKAYRSTCVQQLFQEYKHVFFPFDDVIRIRNICHTYIATAADARGYIRSMSTFQNFRNIHPHKAERMLQEYQERIMELLGTSSPAEDTPLKYQRNYFLILCRNSKGTINIL